MNRNKRLIFRTATEVRRIIMVDIGSFKTYATADLLSLLVATRHTAFFP